MAELSDPHAPAEGFLNVQRCLGIVMPALPVVSMRVGGHRRLGVPPEAAYGVKGGLDGKVPPNASLAYDIELVDVQ